MATNAISHAGGGSISTDDRQNWSIPTAVNENERTDAQRSIIFVAIR
jgi:hypothetical protein